MGKAFDVNFLDLYIGSNLHCIIFGRALESFLEFRDCLLEYDVSMILNC